MRRIWSGDKKEEQRMKRIRNKQRRQKMWGMSKNLHNRWLFSHSAFREGQFQTNFCGSKCNFAPKFVGAKDPRLCPLTSLLRALCNARWWLRKEANSFAYSKGFLTVDSESHKTKGERIKGGSQHHFDGRMIRLTTWYKTICQIENNQHSRKMWVSPCSCGGDENDKRWREREKTHGKMLFSIFGKVSQEVKLLWFQKKTFQIEKNEEVDKKVKNVAYHGPLVH